MAAESGFGTIKGNRYAFSQYPTIPSNEGRHLTHGVDLQEFLIILVFGPSGVDDVKLDAVRLGYGHDCSCAWIGLVAMSVLVRPQR